MQLFTLLLNLWVRRFPYKIKSLNAKTTEGIMYQEICIQNQPEMTRGILVMKFSSEVVVAALSLFRTPSLKGGIRTPATSCGRRLSQSGRSVRRRILLGCHHGLRCRDIKKAALASYHTDIHLRLPFKPQKLSVIGVAKVERHAKDV